MVISHDLQPRVSLVISQKSSVISFWNPHRFHMEKIAWKRPSYPLRYSMNIPFLYRMWFVSTIKKKQWISIEDCETSWLNPTISWDNFPWNSWWWLNPKEFINNSAFDPRWLEKMVTYVCEVKNGGVALRTWLYNAIYIYIFTYCGQRSCQNS